MTVVSLADAKQAEEAARQFSRATGFPTSECEQIALATTELASNLVKHAKGGTLSFEQVEDGERQGMQIESLDDGPGIANFEQALTDGYSTAGSLGTGLGAVNRLMDDLQCDAAPSGGARIVCRRWLYPAPHSLPNRRLDLGVATRAFRMMRENGDAFIVRQWGGRALAGVIDGLGHGQLAQRAAQTARHYIEQHFHQPLPELFRGVGRACLATRGVVMALASFDLERQRFALANVGNIVVRVIGSSMPINAVVRRGVLGLNAPAPVVTEHPWEPESIVIMHSDGFRTHWDWNDFLHLAKEPAGAVAQQLLRALGKEDDDATCVVIRNAR